MARNRFSYKIYDEHANVLNEAALSLPTHAFFSKWDEFKEFHSALESYDDSHQALLRKSRSSVAEDDTDETSTIFPFSNYEDIQQAEEDLEAKAKKLAQAASSLANHAIKARKGIFLGMGTNEKAYTEMSNFLKQAGDYIESKIIDTPWYVPVTKESYSLVAFKDSPEAFLEAQKSDSVNGYIKELNRIKREHNTLIQEKNDETSLSLRVKKYIEHVNNANEKFNTIGATYLRQIQTIESKRRSRWGITNALIDLFDGSEKNKLAELKSHLKVADTLEKSYKELANGTKPLTLQANFFQFSNKLLQDNVVMTESEISALREAVIELSTIKETKGKIAAFLKQLKETVIRHVKNLDKTTESNTTLANQLLFLAENKIEDMPALKEIHASIVKEIKSKLESFDEPENGLAYIRTLEKLDAAIKIFDINLHQAIQNKKNQFEKWGMLSQTWDELLDEHKAHTLSDEHVNHFIEAILWLDELKIDTENDFIKALKELTGEKKSKLGQIAKEKLVGLKEKVLLDLDALDTDSISKERSDALRHRLKFASQANAMYTNALGDLRSNVIKVITTQLKKERSIQSLKRYLDDLESALPADLISDHELAAAIREAKYNLVKRNFSEEQKKLHAEYQQELKFLQTGDLNLWETIKSTLFVTKPLALTEENIQHWRTNFLLNYTQRLASCAETTAKYGFFKSENEKKDAQILNDYLQQSIRDDYQFIAAPLKLNLLELADMRRKAALQKLDKIFGLEPSKPVDINLFMFRYLAVASYQRSYADNPIMVESGRQFIREFQRMAQHEGGFTTQIIAKLPLDALNAMHATWEKNPDLSTAKSGDVLHLKQDIVGQVSETQDTHVQLPRYLLVNMVLELIVADFDALLRGEKIDLKLLNDKIDFVIPKLEQQVKIEDELNRNNGTELRNHLSVKLNALTMSEVKDQYWRLVVKHLPENFANVTRMGTITNLSECENKLLEQLKTEIKDQIDTITSLSDADLDCQCDEKIVKETDALLKDCEEKLKALSSSVTTEHERIDPKTQMEAFIRQMTQRKNEHLNKIAEKKAKIAWLKETQDGLESTLALLKNNRITLREFISTINPRMFDLLDPDMNETCLAIKKNIMFSNLLLDTNFNTLLTKLKDDLKDDSINILDIIREVPDDITNQLPAQTADMIRQLQYRFADRFKHLMVKMLDNNHLLHLDQQVKKEALSEKQVKSTCDKSYLGSWVSSGYCLFQSVTGGTKTESTTAKETPRDRLESVLKNINSDTIKKMLGQLMQAADTNDVSLAHLYQIIGSSAPINITARCH